ncbi:hypothetical protein Hypma_004710 [Hypsizygus marmoreus]|uniref:Uncharacterized protein n=1 Tax=Hypsizygus marmoreus TaxID=39966 RepID=A0A369J3S7_HYPMA|nr:hypothetical protein Hypma_004710 [Hypsizygus marmoreus]
MVELTTSESVDHSTSYDQPVSPTKSSYLAMFQFGRRPFSSSGYEPLETSVVFHPDDPSSMNPAIQDTAAVNGSCFPSTLGTSIIFLTQYLLFIFSIPCLTGPLKVDWSLAPPVAMVVFAWALCVVHWYLEHPTIGLVVGWWEVVGVALKTVQLFSSDVVATIVFPIIVVSCTWNMVLLSMMLGKGLPAVCVWVHEVGVLGKEGVRRGTNGVEAWLERKQQELLEPFS